MTTSPPEVDVHVDDYLERISQHIEALRGEIAALHSYLTDNRREMSPEQVQRFVEDMEPMAMAGALLLQVDLGRTFRRERGKP